MSDKSLKQIQAEIDKLRKEEEIYEAKSNLKANQTRGRALAIGTAFGGTVEVSIRMRNGETAWVLLQPVETTEVIHQLAAQIGCHIALKPRKDFGSWRMWDDTLPALGQNTGIGIVGAHPTFSQWPEFEKQDPAELPTGYSQGNLALSEQGKDLSRATPVLEEKSKGKKRAVATKKTVNKRTTKRASRTSK
jgi:hypothetical protein